MDDLDYKSAQLKGEMAIAHTLLGNHHSGRISLTGTREDEMTMSAIGI